MVQLYQVDNNYLSVLTEDYSILQRLKKYFAVPVPGAKFSPLVKQGRWNGIQEFFNISSTRLPIGLLSELCKYFKEQKIEYYFEGEWNIGGEIWTDEEVIEFYKAISSEDYSPFDHQVQAFKKVLKAKRMIAKLPTGAGKSYLIYGIIRFLLEKNKKILLIVPTTSLVEQMYSDFKDYGWGEIELNCEKLYASEKPTYKLPVLISTWQSLYKKDKEFFSTFNCVIVDETHCAGASSLQNILKYCNNADWRIGTTGTVPIELYHRYKVLSWIGTEFAPITTMQLIEKDLLSNIQIKVVMLEYPEAIRKKNHSRQYADEIRFIESYSDRNKAIIEIFKNIKPKSNTLILATHLNHIDTLQEFCMEHNLAKKVHIVKGSVETKIREDIRKITEVSEGNIIIASFQTFQAGINIKNLEHIILAATSKSHIRIVQSIGRGLRKHDSKEILTVWDMADYLGYVTPKGKEHFNYAAKHAGERIGIYKSQEFSIEQIDIKL